MYKLVPKKRKHILLKIIGILFACAIIKEVIVAMFGPPPVSQQLHDFAQSTNKRCPIVIDSITTLNTCSALPGDRLHFNYQFHTIDKEEIDTFSLAINWREEMINRIKTDPSMSVFKKNELAVSASYYDMSGRYIMAVAVTPRDYKEK